MILRITCGALCLIALAGCGGPSKAAPEAAKPVPAAKIEGAAVKEADLASIILTPEAEKRLGITTREAGSGAGAEYREFAADLALPAGRSLTVPAPLAGTLHGGQGLSVGAIVAKGQTLFTVSPLLPLPRDLRVTAEADVDQAKTRVDTAKLRVARAEKMLKDDVGTVRAVEDAKNELDLANSAWNAARARLDQIQKAPLEGDVAVTVVAPQSGMVRQVLTAPGQVVSGGAPLLEIADFSQLWVRVPIYAGDATSLQSAGSVQVRTLDGAPIGRATAAKAPPTGDPLASTVDWYFDLANSGGARRPGERVLVSLPSRQASRNYLQIPWSAVVFDIHGGAWVYAKTGAHRYTRRRVDLSHEAGGIAYLRAGLEPNAQVVTAGAAELWGTEFGAGK